MTRTLEHELKRLGLDNPDNGFMSHYYKTLKDSDIKRIRSDFKKGLLRKQRICQVTGTKIKQIIRGSHIKPLRHCKNEDECVDYANGLLLRYDLDYLFDKGYISFDAENRIMFSTEIKDVAGSQWLTEMHKLLPYGWLSGWSKGNRDCTIPAMKRPDSSMWKQRPDIAREMRRAVRARAEYMDYHRRHIFQGEAVCLRSGNDN
jgi:hypothetical protein